MNNHLQAFAIIAEVFRKKINTQKNVECNGFICEPNTTLEYVTFYPNHGEDHDMRVVNHQNDWICIIIASKLMYYIF